MTFATSFKLAPFLTFVSGYVINSHFLSQSHDTSPDHHPRSGEHVSLGDRMRNRKAGLGGLWMLGVSDTHIVYLLHRKQYFCGFLCTHPKLAHLANAEAHLVFMKHPPTIGGEPSIIQTIIRPCCFFALPLL